ncbi:hypothetical protein FMK56_12445 [Klebsiella oxytoca]|uniref:hypothetical protein n=1 Tax=Klebsiella oxytoca TaxID=571 RepID=UPI001CCD71FB|nr:hypothetical protein [Klebsiella oxytoca]MBZ7165174.1 hypothetical protein [Klebsiella oxytoca]HEJ9371219.1 hypothetical protein [Klebsiella oxytoca]
MMEYVAMAGAGLNAINGISSANSAAKQSNLNASLLNKQASNIALQTGSQVNQIRQQGSQTLAQQSAGFADNGTGTGGSNALIQRSTAIDTELDAATADYNGRVQIANVNNQANALRAQAKAQKPGLMSLLGGAASTIGAGVTTATALGKTKSTSGLLNLLG